MLIVGVSWSSFSFRRNLWRSWALCLCGGWGGGEEMLKPPWFYYKNFSCDV